MSTKYVEYLLQAKFCRDMAERSGSFERKAEWLRLARQWISLGEPKAAIQERLNAPWAKRLRKAASS